MRPRKYENNGLPQNLLCRRRRRANRQVVEYYYYVLNGGKEKALGKDKLTAVMEAAKLNFEFKQKSDLVLFIDVAERYKLEIIPQKKAKSTQKSNLYGINWLCKFFGDPPIPLEKIEPQHVKQYLEWRKDTPIAANSEIALLGAIWNAAREWGYTNLISPTTGVKRFPAGARKVYVEDFILEKIYQFSDPQLRDIIDTAYLLGQRPIDICKIHRSHIYDGILHITQQKTGKLVRFSISGKLKEIIDRRLDQNSDWLFTNKFGKKLERASLSGYFKETKNKAIKAYPELEKEIDQVQIRDLRAKAATDIALRTDDKIAQHTLGHTSNQMTKRYIRKDKVLSPIDEILQS